jgi:glucose-6-phosphate 1-dehydrogenase
VVVEKPFGHDVASAHVPNDEVRLPFVNTMFEPIWNRNYVSCVRITMAESFPVEDRGHFYIPQAPATRDATTPTNVMPA